MHAPLTVPEGSDRATRYGLLLPQATALLQGERDAVAAMANIASLVHGAFQWHWTGFYRVIGEELVLGPFQGPPACSTIAFGRGVCGSAWAEGRTLIVPDVELFPGHIACSALSRSEIVVPIRGRNGQWAAVLDIDSSLPNDFDALDQEGLAAICALLGPLIP